MNSKITSREKIISCFHDGQIIAVGGQAGPRTLPNRLIDCILESGARHLTIYSIDASDPGLGLGKLIRAGRVDKMITTHIGMNAEAVALFAEGGLAMGGSQSKVASGPQDSITGVYKNSFDVALGVNPGISAFLTNNMAIEVNIGVLGFNYSKTNQISNQVVTGTTSASQMNFKVNIFSIGLGASFYL